MIKLPKQLWLIPLLMGVFFYSCRDGSRADIHTDLDLRYGVCAAVLGLLIIVILSSIPWDKLE